MFLARTMFCTFLVAGIAMAQSGTQAKQGKTQPKQKQTAAAAAASTAGPMVPPANAEKVDENTYRAKDAEGKVWMYRKTPFGWSRGQEGASDGAVTAPANPGAAYLKVTGVEGDTIRFEKATPFGASRWTKKKSELTADEAEALVRFENPGRADNAGTTSSRQ